jgi:hypothetical protein
MESNVVVDVDMLVNESKFFIEKEMKKSSKINNKFKFSLWK